MTGVVVAAALAYCLFHLLLRPTLSSTIAVDDVEQLVLVQDWRLGYVFGQPPLYSWALLVIEGLVGPNLWALSIAKYTVLFATVVFFHLAARRLTDRPAFATLATLSLTLVYLIGYKVHRGYAHTMSLMLLCAATLYLLARLRQSRALSDYLLFGGEGEPGAPVQEHRPPRPVGQRGGDQRHDEGGEVVLGEKPGSRRHAEEQVVRERPGLPKPRQ